MVIMQINLGTDIDREWSFENGDIILISDYGNINQAIMNRLNTDLDFYSSFYRKYGGNLWEHMGDLNHATIHEYIRIEVEDIVGQDPRIRNVEATVNKTNSNGVECDLLIGLYDETTTIELNLVIDSNQGVSLNTDNMISEET